MDANTVLAIAVAFQSFELNSGWNSQVVEQTRPIELFQFAQRRSLDVDPAAHTLPFKQGSCVLASEVPNRQGSISTGGVNSVKPMAGNQWLVTNGW